MNEYEAIENSMTEEFIASVNRDIEKARDYANIERREYQKAYRRTHRAALIAAQKRYNERNKEKIQAYQKAYRLKHSKQLRQYQAAYRRSHKEKI